MRFLRLASPGARTVRALALSFILSLAMVCSSAAQADPAKYGKVPDDLLELTTYPPDSLADAVILVDFGDVVVNPRSYQVKMKVHRRIQILTEEGYEWGTVVLGFDSGHEHISKIKGQTYRLDQNGKVVRQKLEKKDIFEESVNNDFKRIRFTLPGLEPGAIIEYTFDYQSEYPHVLPKWSFQEGEPVVWSEFRAELPRTLEYVIAQTGGLNYHIFEEREANRIDGKTRRFRWVLKDLPALRREPFMTAPEDYRASLQLQLASYWAVGHGATPLNNTWDRLAETLLESPSWRQYCEPRGSVERAVRVLANDSMSDTEKLVAIHDHVRSLMTWNGDYGYFPSQGPDDLLKTKRGSVGDLNLMLVSMARAVGLEAEPVLISTRSHGQVIVAYPLLDQFNYLVAGVQIDGETLLVDTTDRHHPYTTLPSRALNGKGWVVREGSPQWINVQPDATFARSVDLNASVSEDGTVAGTVELTDSGYRAVQTRQKIEDGESQFVEDSILESDGARITSYVIAARDSTARPVRVTAEFTHPGYAQAAGDYIYVNPMLVERWSENPLRRPERRFPVDFTYERTSHYQLTLTMPDDYEVAEAPPDIRFSPESGGAFFFRSTRVDGQQIIFETRLNIVQVIFPPSSYDHIRSFFERVVGEHAGQMVLRRVSDSESVVETADGGS